MEVSNMKILRLSLVLGLVVSSSLMTASCQKKKYKCTITGLGVFEVHEVNSPEECDALLLKAKARF